MNGRTSGPVIASLFLVVLNHRLDLSPVPANVVLGGSDEDVGHGAAGHVFAGAAPLEARDGARMRHVDEGEVRVARVTPGHEGETGLQPGRRRAVSR